MKMKDYHRVKEFNLNLLTVFLCVYKHKSITMAAKELGCSPSATSQAINKLRDFFNDPLFIRTGQKISTTTVGDSLYMRLAEKMIDVYDLIASPVKTNNIVISAPEGIMLKFLEKFIPLSKNTSFSRIVHNNQIVDSEHAQALFSFRKANIIITNEPVISSGITCTKLPTLTFVNACKHDSSFKMKDDHGNINEESVTSFLTKNDVYSMLLDNKFNAVHNDSNFVFQSDSQNMIVNFVEQTNSIGFISRLFLEKVQDSRNIKELEVDGDKWIAEVDVYLNYRTASYDNSLAEVISIFKGLTW